MRKQFLSAITLLLIFTSCSNDDEPFVNLKSTLDIESTTIGNTEGNFIYINLSLTDVLSEDLVLAGEFSTEGIASYINDEDYVKGFEYSGDHGTTWERESEITQVRFKAGISNLKIRIITNDDELPEPLELFKLTFQPVDASNLELSNNLDGIVINASVFDNDLDIRPEESLLIIEFDVAADYSNATVSAIAEEAKSKLEKEVMDGKYSEAVEAALEAFKLLPDDVKIVTFSLLADPANGLGGYVYNQDESGETDKWTMAMNLGFAYENATTYDPQEFNEDGAYGNIFVHEFGHIMTLNQKYQFDILGTGEICNNYENEYEGCSLANSHPNQFNNAFYEVNITNEPTHVSQYAKTNIIEDLAESFAHYATQENIPTSTTASSGALQKINFIQGRSELANLKSQLREIYTLGFLPPSENILARHITKDGIPISCLDHKGLLRAAAERSKK